jgi:hypothetical protein
MTPGTGTRALPPFLIGGALAISAVVAAGLLLYGGVGFVQALVVVLATTLASLGLGLAGGHPPRGPDPVEHLRRRWLFLLLSFSLAAVFSGIWEAFQGLGARGLTQAIGLAFLVALPQYAGGTVLGSLRHLPGMPGGLGAPAPAALLGGATGLIVFGFVFFPTLTATATLLVCLVGLSGAALVQGSTLDGAIWVREGTTPSPGSGSTRVERWERASPPLRRTAILEFSRLRFVIGKASDPVTPLDRFLEEAIPRWHPSRRSSLVLGGGAAPAALGRLLAAEGAEVHLVDPDPALLEACAELASEAEAGGVLRTHRGSLAGILLGAGSTPNHFPQEEGLPEGPFDLVLVHAEELAPFGNPPELPPGALEWLAGRLAPAGVLVMTSLLDDAAPNPILERARPIAGAFPSVSLYVAAPAGDAAVDEVPESRIESWRALLPAGGARGAILVAGTEPEAGWPERLGDVLRVRVEAGA